MCKVGLFCWWAGWRMSCLKIKTVRRRWAICGGNGDRCSGMIYYKAVLVKLVYTPDLGSGGATRPGSSPGDGTIIFCF